MQNLTRRYRLILSRGAQLRVHFGIRWEGTLVRHLFQVLLAGRFQFDSELHYEKAMKELE
jgi:hypothetical protein